MAPFVVFAYNLWEIVVHHPDVAWAVGWLIQMNGCKKNAAIFFNLFWYDRDRTLTRSLVERAERAGYNALVITVDLPELGNRRRSQRERFDQIPPYLRSANTVKLIITKISVVPG